jgi:hypothetical protein
MSYYFISLLKDRHFAQSSDLFAVHLEFELKVSVGIPHDGLTVNSGITLHPYLIMKCLAFIHRPLVLRKHKKRYSPKPRKKKRLY